MKELMAEYRAHDHGKSFGAGHHDGRARELGTGPPPMPSRIELKEEHAAG